MSSSYISTELRRHVAERAGDSCEYCLVPILFGFATPYHIDHIISEKHGGPTAIENLALACPACNLYKGSDIATYLAKEEVTVRLYHPRKDPWTKHFNLDDQGHLSALTKVAKGTIQLLNLNDPDYSLLRKTLMEGNIKLLPTD